MSTTHPRSTGSGFELYQESWSQRSCAEREPQYNDSFLYRKNNMQYVLESHLSQAVAISAKTLRATSTINSHRARPSIAQLQNRLPGSLASQTAPDIRQNGRLRNGRGVTFCVGGCAWRFRNFCLFRRPAGRVAGRLLAVMTPTGRLRVFLIFLL